ncbi:MAG: tRNA (adenosine(37)-N6)-threonylcarbamoyltransferase complex dimerization subunit type 1 TsaB, partial [Armatimonadota bacterium]|nr:tRNA (adenosine(37)-N6)-threonylcarbamoyltransferase complex dimerization subunit type 1 TsaB [Armatimonadota bacterium]
MLVLAFDTSGDVCTIAVAQDGTVLSEYRFCHKMSLLRRLLPNIERTLSDAAYRISDVEAFVVGLGPGSFTGLRIGVTIAKSLAYSLEKPIYGVGSLDALAWSIAPAGTELICPLTHARADEAYWTLTDSSAAVRLAEYRAAPIREVLDDLAARNAAVYFCGSAALRHQEAIRNRLGALAVIGHPGTAHPSAWGLVALGMHRIQTGEPDNPLMLTP